MLKFILKNKDGQQVEVASFETIPEGDAWAIRTAADGRAGLAHDSSFTMDQLLANGLLPQNAASVSNEPLLDSDNQPVLDEETQEPATYPLYHFAKEWSVDVSDITAEVEQKAKIVDRKAVREMCGDAIDLLAAYNEDQATPEQMASFTSNPAFLAIGLYLLWGAPKTAKALILQHGASVYPQGTVDEIVSVLDKAIAL